VKYALEGDGWGMIDHWMRSIRDVYRIHAQELDEYKNVHDKMRRLVELNVAEQVVNIFKTPSVQHSVKHTAFPKVHGLVYDIETGLLTNIPVNLVTDPLHRYDHVYLFSKPPTEKSPHHNRSSSEHKRSDSKILATTNRLCGNGHHHVVDLVDQHGSMPPSSAGGVERPPPNEYIRRTSFEDPQCQQILTNKKH
jgi:hypothetical protein